MPTAFYHMSNDLSIENDVYLLSDIVGAKLGGFAIESKIDTEVIEEENATRLHCCELFWKFAQYVFLHLPGCTLYYFINTNPLVNNKINQYKKVFKTIQFKEIAKYADPMIPEVIASCGSEIVYSTLIPINNKDTFCKFAEFASNYETRFIISRYNFAKDDEINGLLHVSYPVNPKNRFYYRINPFVRHVCSYPESGIVKTFGNTSEGFFRSTFMCHVGTHIWKIAQDYYNEVAL